MSRVITFSRIFPAYHPKAGQSTLFVEKLLKSLNPHRTFYMAECEWCGWRGMSSLLRGGPIADTGCCGDMYCPSCDSNKVDESDENRLEVGYYNQNDNVWPKYHTIRAGHRWKVGDKFSPRVWSGNPYNSKQVIIAPDIEIKKVWNFEIANNTLALDGKEMSPAQWIELAQNDGLKVDEMLNWFRYPREFSGQVICWNPDFAY